MVSIIGTLNEAIASGGTLVRPAEKVFWGGFRGYFSDPDGFLWEVCYNPTLGASIVLPVVNLASRDASYI